jgi:hypothetical protein
VAVCLKHWHQDDGRQHEEEKDARREGRFRNLSGGEEDHDANDDPENDQGPILLNFFLCHR